MRLKTENVLKVMEKKEITEDMLPAICGIRHIRDNCFISPYHARRLSKILDVSVSEIAEDIV